MPAFLKSVIQRGARTLPVPKARPYAIAMASSLARATPAAFISPQLPDPREASQPPQPNHFSAGVAQSSKTLPVPRMEPDPDKKQGRIAETTDRDAASASQNVPVLPVPIQERSSLSAVGSTADNAGAEQGYKSTSGRQTLQVPVPLSSRIPRIEVVPIVGPAGSSLPDGRLATKSTGRSSIQGSDTMGRMPATKTAVQEARLFQPETAGQATTGGVGPDGIAIEALRPEIVSSTSRKHQTLPEASSQISTLRGTTVVHRSHGKATVDRAHGEATARPAVGASRTLPATPKSEAPRLSIGRLEIQIIHDDAAAAGDQRTQAPATDAWEQMNRHYARQRN